MEFEGKLPVLPLLQTLSKITEILQKEIELFFANRSWTKRILKNST